VRGVVEAEAGATDGGRLAGTAGFVGVGAFGRHEDSSGQRSGINGQMRWNFDYEISVRWMR